MTNSTKRRWEIRFDERAGNERVLAVRAAVGRRRAAVFTNAKLKGEVANTSWLTSSRFPEDRHLLAQYSLNLGMSYRWLADADSDGVHACGDKWSASAANTPEKECAELLRESIKQCR